MKIFFSNYDSINNPYYGGGGALAVHEVAKRLVGKHGVTVITGKYPGSKDEVLDGVNYERIGIASPPQLAQLVFQFLLPWYARRKDFDVFVESFTPPFSTSFLPLLTKKPIVGLTHMLGGQEMFKKYKLPFHIIEQIGLRHYKYCIVLTGTLKEKVLKINPKISTKVIANGVDPELLKESSTPEAKHILFIGRLDVNQKGLDILLDAYKKIENDITVPLIIAGKGVPQDEEFLKNRIKELKLEEKVKLVGRVVGEEKKKLFRQASFVVAPSRYENFPLIVYETFCFALPLIITDIPGYSWVPTTPSDKVPKENPEVLANAMLYLYNNPDQRKIMGTAAREYVKNFSWDSIAEKYEEYLNEVTKG